MSQIKVISKWCTTRRTKYKRYEEWIL